MRALFRFIDPSFDSEGIGWKNFLFYLFFWHTSEKGRRYRYLMPIQTFMERKGEIFRNAPKTVIQNFNQLLEILLGQKKSATFLIPQEWGRTYKTRVEKIIEKGQKDKEAFLSIVHEMKAKEGSKEKKEEFSVFKPWELFRPHEEADEKEELFLGEKKEIVLAEDFGIENRFMRPPYDRFEDLLCRRDDSLPERLEERKRLLESFLVRKRTLMYQIRQIQEEDSTVDTLGFEQKIETLSLEGLFFEKDVSVEEAEKKIDYIRQTLASLESTIRQKWRKYSQEIVNQCLLLGDVSVKLSFQLWPFISQDLVWKDMAERSTSLRSVLLAIFHSILESSTPELIERLFYQALQLDDVKALHGELFYRSTREKDIVESAEELLLESVYFFVLSCSVQLHDREKQLRAMMESLLEIIIGCMTPTESFPHMTFREEVSELFRDSWERLEEIRAKFFLYKEQIFSEISEEKRNEYVRRLFLFLSDIEHGNLASIGDLYASFQKEEQKSAARLIEWQRKILPERIGRTSILISLSLPDRRKKEIEFLAFSRKKEEDIRDFAKSCIAAVHSDALFVQTLLWNMSVLVDFLFIKAWLTSPYDEVRLEKTITKLLDQIERSLKLWWRTTPSSIKVRDETLLSRVENHTVWSRERENGDDFSHTRSLGIHLLQEGGATYKGHILKILLYMYDLFLELKTKEGLFPNEFLLRVSAFLKTMVKDVLMHEFILSPILYEVLQDILHDMREKIGEEQLTECNKIFHILQKIEEICATIKTDVTQESAGHSLPLIGDVSFFLRG